MCYNNKIYIYIYIYHNMYYNIYISYIIYNVFFSGTAGTRIKLYPQICASVSLAGKAAKRNLCIFW